MADTNSIVHMLLIYIMQQKKIASKPPNKKNGSNLAVPKTRRQGTEEVAACGSALISWLWL